MSRQQNRKSFLTPADAELTLVLKLLYSEQQISLFVSMIQQVSPTDGHKIFLWENEKKCYWLLHCVRVCVCPCPLVLFVVTFLHMVWDWAGGQEASPTHAISLSC